MDRQALEASGRRARDQDQNDDDDDDDDDDGDDGEQGAMNAAEVGKHKHAASKAAIWTQNGGHSLSLPALVDLVCKPTTCCLA